MKRPLTYGKAYVFDGEEEWDYARPLRAMAQWVTRHPDVVVLAVGVNVNEDSTISVFLALEDTKL